MFLEALKEQEKFKSNIFFKLYKYLDTLPMHPQQIIHLYLTHVFLKLI